MTIAEALKGNTYPGRGVLIGKSADGKHAIVAYFIMGRSENSCNRIFVKTDDGIRTEAYDATKLTDPSLVIYAPVRVLDEVTIVTNGDQTDTIYDFLQEGKTFAEALCTREFEPDPPIYTPRISGMMVVKSEQMETDQASFTYALSILKSANGNGQSCQRFFFEYAQPVNGEGHLIHTYLHDGNPVPSYQGEPKTVALGNNLDELANTIWDCLDEERKVSLYVSFTPLAGGETTSRIINKHEN